MERFEKLNALAMKRRKTPATRGRLAKKNPMIMRGYRKQAGIRERFVNDTGGRVEDLADRGYVVLSSNEDGAGIGDVDAANPSTVGTVMTKTGRRGTKMVLMGIPEELYRKDQEKKQKELDEQQALMNHQNTDRALGRYGSVTQSVSVGPPANAE